MTIWPANPEILTILLFLKWFANIEHQNIQAKHVVFPYSSPSLLKTGLCSEVTRSLPHWVWLQGAPFSETATENLCPTHADRSCPCHMESPFSIWGRSISLYFKKLAEQVFPLFCLPESTGSRFLTYDSKSETWCDPAMNKQLSFSWFCIGSERSHYCFQITPDSRW